MTDDYAVSARGLVKRYGDNTALAGIDLDVPAGTVTAVLGPNGAGKTTAVRILTTLTEADEGRARVAGYDVRSHPHEVRRRIGLTAQDATVDPLLTGRENLVMLGELHGLRRRDAVRRASQLLSEFSLDEPAERLADDIVVIDHGRIIARGDARKLKREVGSDQIQVVVVEPGQLGDAASIVAEHTGFSPSVDVA